MRRRLLVLCFATAILVLAPHVANAQNAKDAESFIRLTYNKYNTKSSSGPDFTGRNASSVFSPSLVQLIRRDQREARGEVGKLDGDPICDCQDFDGLKLTEVRIAMDADSKATAFVTLLVSSDASARNLRILLVRLAQGWRIDDIATKETPSLRKLLQ
jgi:hypothetical protein